MNPLMVYAPPPGWVDAWCEAWGVRCAERDEGDRAEEAQTGGDR